MNRRALVSVATIHAFASVVAFLAVSYLTANQARSKSAPDSAQMSSVVEIPNSDVARAE